MNEFSFFPSFLPSTLFPTACLEKQSFTQPLRRWFHVHLIREMANLKSIIALTISPCLPHSSGPSDCALDYTSLKTMAHKPLPQTPLSKEPPKQQEKLLNLICNH